MIEKVMTGKCLECCEALEDDGSCASKKIIEILINAIFASCDSETLSKIHDYLSLVAKLNRIGNSSASEYLRAINYDE